MKEDKSNIYLLAIVGIVAIVALVVMISGSSKTSYTKTARVEETGQIDLFGEVNKENTAGELT